MQKSGSWTPAQWHKTVGLLVFVAALILYIGTLAPTYVWGDSTKLLFYVLEKNFVGLGPGYGTHPLHNLLGYAFSFLPVSFAYSQNLLSACFAAGTVYLAFRIVMESVRDIPAALAASASMAVSHMFWLYAVINESYSLLSFFTLLALYLCLKWTDRPRDRYLYALSAVLGAGLSNHALLVLAFPGFLYMIWGNRLREFSFSWRIGVAFLAFLAGSSQILLLPVLESGGVLSFASQLAGHTSSTYQVFSGTFSKLMRELFSYPLYLLYQFPGFAIVLGGIGLVVGLRRSRRLTISSMLIVIPILLFASQFMKQRQFPMLITTFNMYALWVGLGTFYLLERYPSLRGTPTLSVLLVSLVLLPPIVYYAASRIAETVQYDVSFIRAHPYRNPYRYYLFPPKNAEYGPQRYVADSFRHAKPGAVILADFVPGMVLLYDQQVLGNRKDLEIGVFIDDWIHHSTNPAAAILDYVRTQAASRRKTLYLADDWEAYYHSSEIRKEFRLEQTGGPLWEVFPIQNGMDTR
jgi:hypothetical protein